MKKKEKESAKIYDARGFSPLSLDSGAERYGNRNTRQEANHMAVLV